VPPVISAVGAESEMPLDGTVDIEDVGVVPLATVAVGGRDASFGAAQGLVIDITAIEAAPARHLHSLRSEAFDIL